jgi:putative ABC transport system ATP-binding protein
MASDPATASVLAVEDVTKRYSMGDVVVEALRGISFEVCAGEYVAIMGESGSGKTTLLGILGCLDRPTSGSYKLVGEEMSALPETRRARVRGDRIGFVFQAYNLLPRSNAYQNVELPLVYARVPARERRPRVLAALEAVGLAARTSHYPNQLSGGEQQRVGIARALVTGPSVVLADEATGNLDSASADEVLATIDRLHENGTTIVLVTHSHDVARRASRILRVADGRLVGDSATERAA